MLKIGILGIAGILTAIFMKEVKPSFAVWVSMTTCLLIFFYAVNKISFLTETIEGLQEYIQLKDSYLATLLKLVGITYVADFSSNLCKDAGYGAIAGQIEFFGKISILTISAPIVLALLETISEFLA